MASLTARQRLFVAYYLGEAKGNASKAALMAGYTTPHPTGHRLLRKATVKAAIERKMNEVALTSDEILAELAAIATATIDDFVTLTPEGGARIDLEKAKARGKLGCIKKIKTTDMGLEVEPYSRTEALGVLAKFRGLLTEKVELSGPNGAALTHQFSAALDNLYGPPPGSEPKPARKRAKAKPKAKPKTKAASQRKPRGDA